MSKRSSAQAAEQQRSLKTGSSVNSLSLEAVSEWKQDLPELPLETTDRIGECAAAIAEIVPVPPGTNKPNLKPVPHYPIKTPRKKSSEIRVLLAIEERVQHASVSSLKIAPE